MYHVRARNVNEALPIALSVLKEHGVMRQSRYGDVIEYPGLFVTEYTVPQERVLFNPWRDANPFFHFMESMWILAGRDDVEFVSKFNSRIKEFSDDGIKFHGAYGWRMRITHGNQLRAVIDMLKKDPNTRRAVVQIWDADKDLRTTSNDIPCNDLIMFKVRDGRLNMTVNNRSNDAIWGCYGANAVHFSYVQEYVARAVGVGIGSYYQVSDSLHAYINNPQWEVLTDNCPIPMTYDYYVEHGILPYDMTVEDLDEWDLDCAVFCDDPFIHEYVHPFFEEVAVPMYRTWVAHKKNRMGLHFVESIKAEDWRTACKHWLIRRYDK